MARTRTRTATRTRTRTQLLEATALQFFSIAKRRGTDVSWETKNLEIMISMQLVKSFEIVVWKDEEPCGGIKLTFDWERHYAIIDAYGEDVDVSHLNDDQLHGSVEDSLAAAEKYVESLFTKGGATYAQCWFSYNQKQLNAYGVDRIRELIQLNNPAPSSDFEVVRRAKLKKGTERTSAIADLNEASISAW